MSLCMRGGRAWQLLQRLHAWMAWLMKAPAALVQLAMLMVVLRSVLSYVVGFALNDIGYAPVIFGEGYWSSTAVFLENQVLGLGSFFTPLVLAAALVGIAALLVLGPSLLEELAPDVNIDTSGVRSGAAQWSARLGRWLEGASSEWIA